MLMNSKNRNTDHVEINDKKIPRKIIEVLEGEKGEEELREEWIPIAEALKDPEEFPFLLSDILKVKRSRELRRALIRVQINSQLKREENLDLYKKQLFTAETIEILLFQRLRLKGKKRRRRRKKKIEEEEDEEEEEGEEVVDDDEDEEKIEEDDADDQEEDEDDDQEDDED
ncbi:MAG: hypothetical protein ACLFNY_06260 [Candidatus Aenigmatarchaeota archaeon]